MPFQPLDPLLHSELRLAVMSLLISADEAEFPYIKEQTGATAGNLSVQVDKLSEAGYIDVEKTFKGKRPCTICRICLTPQRASNSRTARQPPMPGSTSTFMISTSCSTFCP